MNKSHLLINEPALQVLPSLARAIGLDEAIAIQQVHYWLNNAKGGVEKNGYKWVYNTYAEWQEDNFPFWSVEKIQRVFLSLEKIGVIVSEQLEAKSRNMTKFYRIDYDALNALDGVKIESSHSIKSESSNTAKLHDVNNESETTTETTHKASAKTTRPNDKHFDAILSVCCPDEQLTESYKQANKSWIARTANNGCREFPADLITKAYGAGGWWYEVRCKNITPKPTPTPESIKKTITLAAAYYKSLNQAETKVYDDGSFDA